MAAQEPTAKATPEATEVLRPVGRAFFVYYVWILVWLLGPRINPALGVPVWLGVVLALPVAAAVVYMKWGQEYQLTPRGVVKAVRWPSPRRQEIVWGAVGEVQARRGLTQTLLRVGNLLIHDLSGGPPMFWFGLADPKTIKEKIERRRPA